LALFQEIRLSKELKPIIIRQEHAKGKGRAERFRKLGEKQVLGQYRSWWQFYALWDGHIATHGWLGTGVGTSQEQEEESTLFMNVKILISKARSMVSLSNYSLVAEQYCQSSRTGTMEIALFVCLWN